MKQRCYYKKHDHYRIYGGRGIGVCDEWLDNFQAFEKWALSKGYKRSLQIDRIDNDGNYEPSNCRFVTPAVNTRKQAKVKLTTGKVTEIKKMLSGKRLTQQAIGDIFGVSRTTISFIKAGKRWRNLGNSKQIF